MVISDLGESKNQIHDTYFALVNSNQLNHHTKSYLERKSYSLNFFLYIYLAYKIVNVVTLYLTLSV